MKKFLSVFITVLMLVQMIYIPVSADAAKDVVFTLSEATKKAGETVTLTLTVTSNTTEAYDTVVFSGLTYDKDVLAFAGFSGYETLVNSNGLNLSTFDASNGVIMLAGITMAGTIPMLLNGNVCTLNFTVLDDAKDGDYGIDFSKVEIKRAGKVVPSELVSGSVTVYHDHSMTYTPAADAFCNAPGVKENWFCSICKKYFSDAAGNKVLAEIIVPMVPDNHAGGTEIRGAKTESCGKDGYTGDTYCLGCQKKVTDGSVIPATGKHSGGTATCVTKADCIVCGQSYGVENPDNHTGETEVIDDVEPTCAKDGYTGDIYCADCVILIEKGSVILATGEHTGGEATCIDEAVCTVCGNPYGTVNPDNHKGETEVRDAEAATCDADGYTGDTYCLDCNELILPGDIISATGDHVDADGKWETDGTDHWYTCGCGTTFDKAAHKGGEATCTAKAVCEVCSAEYGDKNPDNHKGETEVRDAEAATCDADGYTGDTYCKACGNKIADGEVILATGEHVDADGAWETDGTNHWCVCGCGAEFDKAAHNGGEATCIAKAVCETCEAEYGDVDASNHKGETEVRDAKAATCSEDGYTGDTYCLDCDTKIADGEVISATGEHVDADGKWDSDEDEHWSVCGCGEIFAKEAHKGGEATCVAKAECSECGEEYGEINAKNHKNTEIRGAKEPTATQPGETGETWCKDCGIKVKDSETIPAKGDSWDDWFWIMQQMQQKKYVITATAGEGGTISNAGRKTVMNGASMTYTITPAEGYEIEAVYVNGVDIGTVGKYTFRKVMTNQTIHVTFAKIGWKNPFTDVADDADYIDAIKFVYENELFIGTSDTTFEPDTTMTRAMFVTVLGRMAGVEPVALPFTAFEDVVLDEWYAPYVDWAEENGIVMGYGDGTFGVDDEITVEQAAVILARFAKYTEVYEESDLDLGEYDDGDEVSDWAAAEMKWALENGVYVPAGYKLAPTEPASRALIAIMLFNYVNELC